jgi:nucleoside-diphosphate-sugar epimerase
METRTNKPNHQTTTQHVILGGGQIGDRLADQLAARGEQVRVVQRTARTDARSNVERVSGDITDPAFRSRALRGASVVYDCMNPLYYQWPEFLLPLGAAVVQGAADAGARLVALDCLYMFGAPNGPLREDSPRRPCSKKGELRLQLEALRMDADKRGDVPVSIGRASDFFGPDLPNSLFGSRFWQRLFAGQTLECPGDPDMPHSFNYADDVARGLATLGQHPEASGQVWHLPASANESTRTLFEGIGRELGRAVRVKAAPQWMIHALGLFNPMIREIAEMTYQWRMPYIIDSTRFRETFGQEATPLATALRETCEVVRKTYKRAA